MFRAFLFVFLAVSAKAEIDVREECLNYTIYPIQYELTITPYISYDRQYYDGLLTITVIANEQNIRVIELEAKDMEIRGETIKVYDGNYNIVDSARPYVYDRELGRLYIYLNRPLIPTKFISSSKNYVIQLYFRKEVTSESRGVFIVKYTDRNNRQRFLVQTRLSPDNTKYFMPCFKDPRFDSVFKFVVHQIPQNKYVVYTNTSLVISEERRRNILSDGTVEINYIPSAQVPLRKLGFHYSDFSNIKITSRKTNDTIIIWAPADQIKNCHLILNFGERLINLIHDYSRENRPLVRGPINIVAVPTELDGYEIDSWNLLTNNAIRIVYQPESTSISQFERMKFELAQQFSRIWLGSSGEMMMTRWREEWFKEGIATYFAYYFLNQFGHSDQITKQWESLGHYGIHMKHAAMLEDWRHSTPALKNFNDDLAVNIPDRYKKLVTLKTASLLWMIDNWVGSQRFHQALVKYITHKRGLLISLEDFLENLDTNTKECFNKLYKGSSAVLNSWFREQGYPVIDVNVVRTPEKDIIVLKQRRFSFTKEHRHETSFLIPVSYTLQNTFNCQNCFKPRITLNEQTYSSTEILNNGWIILNSNASGYYRVNYDEHTWHLIAQTLKNNINAIDEANRAQIVNDVIALYVAGDMSQNLAMIVLDYLDREESPVVWTSVMDAYEMLRIENAECNMTKTIYSEWQVFLRRRVVNVYKIYTTNIDQSQQTRLIRSRIMAFACQVQYQKCLAYMNNSYIKWKNNERRIEPDFRTACYYTIYSKRLPVAIYNAFERDEYKYAENLCRREEHFLVKIPKGEPRPQSYTHTTVNPLELSTKKSPSTEAQPDSGSHVASTLYVILVALVGLFVVR